MAIFNKYTCTNCGEITVTAHTEAEWSGACRCSDKPTLKVLGVKGIEKPAATAGSVPQIATGLPSGPAAPEKPAAPQIVTGVGSPSTKPAVGTGATAAS